MRTASKNQKFQIIICNITDQSLRLVGVYNQIERWPMGDAPAITAQNVDFSPGGAGFFTYSANYATGNTGRFFQVGVSKSPAGRENINVCVEQSAGNGAAENCFDNMSSDHEKSVNTRGGWIRGIKQNMDGKTQWVFFLR